MQLMQRFDIHQFTTSLKDYVTVTQFWAVNEYDYDPYKLVSSSASLPNVDYRDFNMWILQW